MKALCYILCVMVLVLGLIPCADVHAESGKEKVEVRSAADSSNHIEGDTCSPFCQCTCCTSPTLIYLTTSTIAITGRLHKCYGEHLSGQKMETLFSIWQPPRLS
ncbi:DUF6660 family protein [Arcticibacter pallidicorallinus]|uniref:DUF6660 family protein n=1 Tax=Arcticibacter pallidicorallinus TaxID=1259464 RepID=UPI003CCB7F66